MKHKQRLVRYGDIEAKIDVEIAPLIEEIWKAGLYTCNSCQGNPDKNWIWIEFFNSYDAAKFLNIVAKYEEDTNLLYNRITHGWDDMEKDITGFWKYNLFPKDLGLIEKSDEDDSIEESHEGKCEFIFNVSIRFPNSDLSTVLKRLRINNN